MNSGVARPIADVQGIGTASYATPGDYFEPHRPQDLRRHQGLAADQLTWFAIEIVE